MSMNVSGYCVGNTKNKGKTYDVIWSLFKFLSCSEDLNVGIS